MRTIQVYECEHGCGFYKKTMKSVEAHEKRCYYNPSTRSCGTCVYLNNWTCSRGLEFEKKKDNQTPRLRTRCIMYKNVDDVIYGQDDDLEFHQTPFKDEKAFQKHY